MAFIRKKVASYKWPVVVEVPSDGGRFEKQSFDATFKRLGRSEFSKLADQGDTQLLEAVLEGWEGILDEDDKAIPFTAANRRELFEDPYFCRGIIKAYLESLEGAQAKN
jgi:hypothetical protein